MAMHVSILLIEGDHMSRLDEIFDAFHTEFKTENIGEDAMYDTFLEAAKALDPMPFVRNEEWKATCSCNGWTVIIDPNLWMMLTYGFNLYENGEKVRDLCSEDSQIVADSGTPLEIESRIDKSHLFVDDILLVMSSMGVSYEDYTNAGPWVVKGFRTIPTPEQEAEYRRTMERLKKEPPRETTYIEVKGELSKEALEKAIAKASKKKKRKRWFGRRK
ncbi:MAG: hypothetical protein ACW99U_21505 [Candidatus Thorarchaeota archaeon]|jgi:hypothetical protein